MLDNTEGLLLAGILVLAALLIVIPRIISRRDSKSPEQE